MDKDRRLLIRGVGIGIIVATTLFFLAITFIVPKETPQAMTDGQIIDRARELGMIFVSELSDQTSSQALTTDAEFPYTTDEVILSSDAVQNSD